MKDSANSARSQRTSTLSRVHNALASSALPVLSSWPVSTASLTQPLTPSPRSGPSAALQPPPRIQTSGSTPAPAAATAGSPERPEGAPAQADHATQRRDSSSEQATLPVATLAEPLAQIPSTRSRIKPPLHPAPVAPLQPRIALGLSAHSSEPLDWVPDRLSFDKRDDETSEEGDVALQTLFESATNLGAESPGAGGQGTREFARDGTFGAHSTHTLLAQRLLYDQRAPAHPVPFGAALATSGLFGAAAAPGEILREAWIGRVGRDGDAALATHADSAAALSAADAAAAAAALLSSPPPRTARTDHGSRSDHPDPLVAAAEASEAESVEERLCRGVSAAGSPAMHDFAASRTLSASGSSNRNRTRRSFESGADDADDAEKLAEWQVRIWSACLCASGLECALSSHVTSSSIPPACKCACVLVSSCVLELRTSIASIACAYALGSRHFISACYLGGVILAVRVSGQTRQPCYLGSHDSRDPPVCPITETPERA
jgi:hypothetical protein